MTIIRFEENALQNFLDIGSKNMIIKHIREADINTYSIEEIEEVQVITSLFMIRLDRLKRMKVQLFYEDKE